MSTTLNRSRRAVTALIVLSLLALALDQATKAWALRALADGERRPLLGDLLGLRLIFNPGAAFSFGAGSTWVFTIVAVVVVIVIARMARQLTSLSWAIGLALVLAGAVGNLIDRLARPPSFGRGHVIDFIDYGWFIGNVADIWIVAGALFLLLLTLRGVPMTAEDDPEDGSAIVGRRSAEADQRRDVNGDRPAEQGDDEDGTENG